MRQILGQTCSDLLRSLRLPSVPANADARDAPLQTRRYAGGSQRRQGLVSSPVEGLAGVLRTATS